MAVAALARLGRGDDARARAEALRSRYPESAYARRVGALLRDAP